MTVIHVLVFFTFAVVTHSFRICFPVLMLALLNGLVSALLLRYILCYCDVSSLLLLHLFLYLLSLMLLNALVAM